MKAVLLVVVLSAAATHPTFTSPTTQSDLRTRLAARATTSPRAARDSVTLTRRPTSSRLDVMGRLRRSEPLAPCHARADSQDSRGRSLVAYADRTSNAVLSNAISAAVGALNRALRSVRLVQSDSARIEITAVESGPVGQTTLHCTGSTGTAGIVLNERVLAASSGMTSQTARLVVMHEFGHALGLAHTSEPCALMHPNDSDCSHQDMIRLTPSERAAIDGLYSSAPAQDASARKAPPEPSELPPEIYPAPWPRG